MSIKPLPDDDEPDVLVFRDKLDGFKQSPPHVKERVRNWENPSLCEHRLVYYDKLTRAVECGNCGAVLDVLECLIRLSHECEKEDWKVQLIKQERDAKRALDVAKRERAAAIAAKRKAEGRDIPS